MKKLLAGAFIMLAKAHTFAQSNPIQTQANATEPLATEPYVESVFPILLMGFLAFVLASLVKYFLEFRLKNKLIDRGMAEQLSAYLLSNNDQEEQKEVVKMAILFGGIGLGLTLTYLTAPIHIHSLAIMAFSIGLSHLAYFFYLKR